MERKTSRIFFDEQYKTFRLYPGNSLYAFCISPELTLEHLYWGETLHPGYDLRYLTSSSRMTHFTTLEVGPAMVEPTRIGAKENLAELERNWQTIQLRDNNDDFVAFHRRRLENYTWRKLSWIKKITTPNDLTEDGVELKSHSQDNNSVHQKMFSKFDSDFARRRAISSPMHYGPFIQSMDSTSPERIGNSVVLTDYSDSNALDLSTRPENKEQRKMKKISSAATVLLPKYNHPLTSLQSFHPPKPIVPTQVKFDRDEGRIGKGALCLEYSDHGSGDFRSPSFIVVDKMNGSAFSPLRYRKHEIILGKIPLPDYLPGIRCYDISQMSTLVVTMADASCGLEVDLIYGYRFLIYTSKHHSEQSCLGVLKDYDAITRRVVFRNTRFEELLNNNPSMLNDVIQRRNESYQKMFKKYGKVIQKASSLTIDFEYSHLPFHLVHLTGSWARERWVNEKKLEPGMLSFGSTRGVSSHQHNPFAAVSVGPCQETRGEVKLFSLLYSGNFLFEAEINELNRLRINLGIHPTGFQWNLKNGTSFSTPEALIVRSKHGLGGASRTLHRLYNNLLIPKTWADTNPPILLNTWEAKYFNVNHANVVEMAYQAADIGINLIVLDDGWFGNRSNDKTSLGDWIPDLEKFPRGIHGLADEINATGCKFGIWFEPEMVSEDSQLNRMHPDWYLHVPGRPRNMGRNQMVLDLSRAEVRDHIFRTLSAILKSANIEYVKWDMNRPLTEVHSIVQSSVANLIVESEDSSTDLETELAELHHQVWQSEVSHRYVLGLYELQSKIIATFPHILLENCASGGGRYDPGMLYYSPQIWCSDNTDPFARIKIQYGTSIAYPVRAIGAHISNVPNHITGSITRLRTRAFMAMCGTFGYELDITSASRAEKDLFHDQIAIYNKVAPIIRFGDLYRLWDPFKLNYASWMFVSQNKSCAVLFAFSINSDHWSNLVPRLHLQGLLPDTEYELTEIFPNNIRQNSANYQIIETEAPIYQLGVHCMHLTGDILMNAGLPVKFFTLDDSLMYYLSTVQPGSNPNKK